MAPGQSRLKYIIALSVIYSLLCALPLRAGNDHGLGSQQREMQAWWSDTHYGFIGTGCKPAVPASGLVLGAFACTAYVEDSGEWYYIDQSSAGITIADATPTWLAIHRDRSTAVAGWTRQQLTHYLYKQSATRPPNPAGALVFAQLTVSASDITAVTLIDVLSPDSDAAVSALHYGCVGDDATDNATCFSNITASGARFVMFPEGIYRTSAAVCPAAGQTWSGPGARQSVAVIKQTSANTDVVFCTNRSGTALLNLHLSGTNAGTGHGLHYTADGDTPADNKFARLYIDNIGDHCVYMRGTYRTVLLDIQAGAGGTCGGDAFRFGTSGSAGFESNARVYGRNLFASGAGGWGLNIGEGAVANTISSSEFHVVTADSNNVVNGMQIGGSFNSVTGAHIEAVTGVYIRMNGTGNQCSRCESTDVAAAQIPFDIASADNTLIAPRTDGSESGDSIDICGSCNDVVIINPELGTIDDDSTGGAMILASVTAGTLRLGGSTTITWGGNAGNSLRTQMQMEQRNTIGVTGAADMIWQTLPTYGAVAYVNGDDGAGKKFLDVLTVSNLAPPLLLGTTVSASPANTGVIDGAPAQRTYSLDGADLDLAMATGTYDVSIFLITMPNPN